MARKGDLTKQQIAMRAKIRRLFPRKRIGVYLYYQPGATYYTAVINSLGVVGRPDMERILKKSGLFSEVRYDSMLDHFDVFWKRIAR